MEFCINRLQVIHCHMFPHNHFVKTWHEVGIKEPTVEDRKSKHSSDELEVTQVVRVDSRIRIYLKSVVVMCRIFEKTITRIKNFM